MTCSSGDFFCTEYVHLISAELLLGFLVEEEAAVVATTGRVDLSPNCATSMLCGKKYYLRAFFLAVFSRTNHPPLSLPRTVRFAGDGAPRRAVEASFELGRTHNPSAFAYERRSKLAAARTEAAEKAGEFNHWATEAEKHIQHKVFTYSTEGFRSLRERRLCVQRSRKVVPLRIPFYLVVSWGAQSVILCFSRWFLAHPRRERELGL